MGNLNKEWDGVSVRSFTEVAIYDAFMENIAFEALEEKEQKAHTKAAKRKKLLSERQF